MKKIIITLLIILVFVFVCFKIVDKKQVKEKETSIGSLLELFPSKDQKYIYQINGAKTKATVKVSTQEGQTTITISYVDQEKVTVNRIYEITEDKIVESGKSYRDNQLVSEEIATEILTSLPYVGLTYQSVDGLINYEVTEMKNNKITIVSTQKIVDYEKDKPVERDYKINRVFEKGKGLILYETELNGQKNTILKIK